MISKFTNIGHRNPLLYKWRQFPEYKAIARKLDNKRKLVTGCWKKESLRSSSMYRSTEYFVIPVSNIQYPFASPIVYVSRRLVGLRPSLAILFVGNKLRCSATKCPTCGGAKHAKAYRNRNPLPFISSEIILCSRNPGQHGYACKAWCKLFQIGQI